MTRLHADHPTLRRIVRTTVLAALLAGVTTAEGQQPGRRETLDQQIQRVFQSRDYQAPRFGPAQWLADGTAYTALEPATGGAGVEIARYEAATGVRRVLVSSSRLQPAGSNQSIAIDDYDWSPDARWLLIFTNTRKVWRQNTRGDYWVLNIETGRLRQLGAGAPESSLMFAKFSPDSTRVGYVRNRDLYVERVAGGRATRLTTTGSNTIINGTTDWVTEEELDLRDAFRWSPDSRAIAFWQFDTAGVGLFSLINDTDGLYPRVTQFPYPKVGTTNSAVRAGVVSADGGDTLWLKTPGDPRETYIPRMAWVDARTLVVQQLNRLQNRNDVLLADAQSGSVQRVLREESTTWLDVVDEVRWVENGLAFLWTSERDGWRHVYRISRDGRTNSLLTRFDADIIELLQVDEANGWLYFLASPENATQQYLYRCRLTGGIPERVTPQDVPGTHSYRIAPGGRFAFHTYSRFDRPPATDLIALTDHRSLRPLTDPSALLSKLAGVIAQPVEFFSVMADDGVMLDAWMLKPSNFNASRRYPVIVFVYGEPFAQTVLDRWSGSQMLFHRALADAGYLVVSFDNRGTPAPKGAAWRKVVYGSIGELSSKEQAAAIRSLAAQRPYVDSSRVGIWGWSGGGTSTLNAMFRYADVYKAGVAVAPVPDQLLYDTIYQERYMGLPKDNADGYRRGSPIGFADGLKGKLLIVHGTGDDNVHFQGTERLIDRLVQLGKPFDVMVYPNRTHAIAEGAGTTVHLFRLIAHYFLDHLPPDSD